MLLLSLWLHVDGKWVRAGLVRYRFRDDLLAGGG